LKTSHLNRWKLKLHFHCQLQGKFYEQLGKEIHLKAVR
jgi:hypothetical protein